VCALNKLIRTTLITRVLKTRCILWTIFTSIGVRTVKRDLGNPLKRYLMPGHSNSIELGKIRWADAEVQGVAIDYDAVSLRVKESNGAVRTLRAEGYIGYALAGFWDEIVVERAEIADEHPGLNACLESLRRRLGASWLDSGNEARNGRAWSAILVHFSDGSVLEVFAARVCVAL
jgi:hypothetical protein